MSACTRAWLRAVASTRLGSDGVFSGGACEIVPNTCLGRRTADTARATSSLVGFTISRI